MSRAVFAGLLLLLLLVAVPPARAQTRGPGLGNVAFNDAEVFAPVGFVETPLGHGNVAMVQGYLMVITSSDGGGRDTDGTIDFWDISNPRAPQLVIRHESDDTHQLREAHGFSLAWMNDRLVLAAQSVEGIMLWDVTDPLAVTLLAFLDLPDITRGDYSGDWWLFFQAPWLYVAGADSGLYVVDASDVTAPVLVNRLSTGDLAGVSPAQVFVVGNLAVVMEAQNRGLATLDVSAPDAPRLLTQRDGRAGYSHILAGDGKILTSGNIPPQISVHQLSPEGGISHVSTFALFFNSGGYGSYQDGFFHTGFSDRYVKADPRTEGIVGTGTSGRDGRDEDFATVLGNLAFAGDDHGKGTALIPHQAAPDTTAPVVEWLHPVAGDTPIPPSSRFGLSFSDHIDASSLTDETITLVDVDSGARVATIPSAQLSLVNVAPQQPLTPGARYRLTVFGVRDVAGNGSPRFVAEFVVGEDRTVLDPAAAIPTLETSSLFGDYARVVFGVGVRSYLDRDFAWQAGFPARLDGQPALQTRNNDKLGRSADFLRFSLAQPSTVVVLNDVRADRPPTWLTSAFSRTGEQVRNGDTTFDVWEKVFPVGDVVLGGNAATGSSGTESMYGVVILPERLRCALHPTPALVGDVALAVDGPDDARYDWTVSGAEVPERADAGRTITATLPAGRHPVVVTVSRGAERATCSAVQIVTGPPGPPSVSSSPLVVKDGVAFAVEPDHGVLVRSDVETGARLGSHPLSPARGDSTRPVGVAVHDGVVWVVDDVGAALHRFSVDGAALPPVLLPPASAPKALVVDDDGVFVSLSATGEVLRLDHDGATLARANVVATAWGLAKQGGRLFVSRRISPDSHGEVVVVDAATLRTTGVITLAFDDGPDTEASGRGVPSQLSPLVIAEDGRRAFVAGSKANMARGLARDGRALTFESRVRAMVATIDLDTLQEVRALRIDVNDREGIQHLALSPRGDLLFVPSRGGNVVDVFDVLTTVAQPSVSGRRVSQFLTGRAPLAVAVTDSRVLVHEWLDRRLGTFDGRELVAGLASRVTPLPPTALVDAETALSETLLRGKRLFHLAGDPRLSKDGYIACASCHDDGGHDGRTWDFTQAGEGLRNTITLHGRAGLGHGRVHWTANFDEIQDFEHDIRDAFGGTGLMSADAFTTANTPLGAPKAGRSADLDALADYVASFATVPDSPFRDVDGSLTAAGRRGRVVFVAAGCTGCHGGASFQDNARHDTGSILATSGLGLGAPLAGVGFDTPTLLGLWHTGPWLHDGRAATLEDALVAHGGVPALADADRDDLIAYLSQLDRRSAAADVDCAPVDECVRVDGAEGEGEGEGEDEDDGDGEGAGGDVDGGCSCSVDGRSEVAMPLVALWLLRRRRRADGRPTSAG